MNDDEMAEAIEPDPDPRIVAMHRVVDLEGQHQQAVWEVERRQKTAAILSGELREARDHLSGLLGYPSNSDGGKELNHDETMRLVEKRFEQAAQKRPGW